MPGQSIFNYLNIYNVKDFSARGDGNHDDTAAINQAIQAASVAGDAVVYVPPGTYLVSPSGVGDPNSCINIYSGITLLGAGRRSVIKLNNTALGDIIGNVNAVAGTDNEIRIRDLRLDGNRTNNTAGTRNGLRLRGVTAFWLENVEVVSCRGDGFVFEQCEYAEIVGCRASDNGRHGFSLNNCYRHSFVNCRAINNGRVATPAGTGDGFNLDVISTDNTILSPTCEDQFGGGKLQGWGVREVSGGGCDRNCIYGGNLTGNLSGAISLDSGMSIAVAVGNITLPGGLTAVA